MSESNNNIPMRITQLEEVTEYPEGAYLPIAKLGYGTKRISTDVSSKPLIFTKESILQYNCVEMLPLSGLTVQESSGLTFTPSRDGKKITSSGTLSGSSMYIFFNGNIEDSVFKAGGKYKVLYSGPTNAYFQILCNGNAILNTQTFTEPKIITIPNDTTTLNIRLYILSTSQAGDYNISFVNYRDKDYIENNLLSEDDFYKDFKALTGYEKINFFDGVNIINGKYVNYQNGQLDSLSSFSVTDYLKVFYGASYFLNYIAAGSQIAFYNSNYEYVTGQETTSKSFTVPNNPNIKYVRWCADTAHLSDWGLYISPLTETKIKRITTSEGLLAGIIDAYDKGIKKVVVSSGTYDLISEYKAKFGDSYFDDYTSGYNNLINGFYDRGLWLDNIDIEFESGAVVNCDYEGNNVNVMSYFSAFAVGQNVKIDGLVLDSYNLRYGIHPDFHPLSNDEYFIVENCDLHHYKTKQETFNDNQAIGAGLGVYSKWKFKNCIFRSDTDHAVVRIHNNVSSNAISDIIIENCYIVGDGYIRLNSYSTSTKQTRAIVTNCSWLNPVVVGKETSDSNDNITLYAWNNETRTV